MQIEYSIIVPTYNRPEVLRRCLQHLSNLNHPKKGWEILVVDNGSADNTREVVEEFAESCPNLRYFFDARPGLHISRHVGCQKAEGEILCYIDDDSFVDKGWLKGIEKAFSDPEVVLVGGPNLPAYETTPPDWLEGFCADTEHGKTTGYLSLLDFGDEKKEISPYYVYGCNFNIRKNIFIQTGGFHPDSVPKELRRFRGDGESALSRKLIDLEYTAVYSPSVKIHHWIPSSRMTIEYFCNRAYLQGISDSFSKIRANSNLSSDTKKTTLSLQNLSWRAPFRIAKYMIKKVLYGNEPNNEPYPGIKRAVKKALRKGYDFHQNEVKNDPKLLEWVLRENYLGDNGALPN